MYSHKEDMSGYAAELYAMICVDSEPTARLADIIRELTANITTQVRATRGGAYYTSQIGWGTKSKERGRKTWNEYV